MQQHTFFPLVATQYGIDLLMAFSAIGPLYIGYEAKSYLKAVILGIVGATPLLYMAFAGFLGAYTPTEMGDLITSVAILGLGALMAFFGAYLYQGRAKAKEEYDIAKGTKVKKNIANLFLPKGRRKK